MTTIELVEVEAAVLYHRYPRETRPQPVHVTLDCARGRLTAAVDGEIGPAVPARVWHGHVRRWSIPSLRRAAANDLLAEIAPHAQRVCDGYESVWDGHNYVARFDDDAEAAIESIDELCQSSGEYDAARVWDAADWYAPLGGQERQRVALGITAATTDDELDAIEERERDEAEASGECDAIDGLERHLRRLRDGAVA